jgi:very-short-patch-repair endonuclease
MMQFIVEDVKVHHRIGKYSVDIFIPDWKLALEYQGEQHYQTSCHGDVKR